MPDRASAPDDRFAELRSIIVGPEQRKLRALRRHLRDPAAQTREVSRVLPDALQLRSHDPQLMRALAPSVEDAITASVRRNPHALADALFPVIGPAIRKAVAHTFDAMIESLNHSIERSVSWRAVQWRWQAWRTGRPFAEIVLANTLEYRVEQLFLIHRDSGLLLQHVAPDQGGGSEADQISAMLSAITDFVRDSFKVGRAETLDSMRVGELAVTIVQGPQAILAAVVRGSIPPPVRAAFESALESIHRQFGSALQTYAGDSSALDKARPQLEACLVSRRRRARPRPSYAGWAAAAGVLVVGLAVWWSVDAVEQRRWNASVERLSAEPGVVLLASGRRGGSYFVAGLRDPLARDPADVLAGAGFAPDAVQSRWEPYQALGGSTKPRGWRRRLPVCASSSTSATAPRRGWPPPFNARPSALRRANRRSSRHSRPRWRRCAPRSSSSTTPWARAAAGHASRPWDMPTATAPRISTCASARRAPIGC
jgi:OOP family OmpA-OmpF porin